MSQQAKGWVASNRNSGKSVLSDKLKTLYYSPDADIFKNGLDSLDIIETYAKLLGVPVGAMQANFEQIRKENQYRTVVTDIGQYEIDGEVIYVVFHNSFGELEFTSREKFLETISHCTPNRVRWVSDNEPLQDSILNWNVEGQDEYDEYDYPIGQIVRKDYTIVGREVKQIISYELE